MPEATTPSYSSSLPPERQAELLKQRRTPQETAVNEVVGALLFIEAAQAIYGGGGHPYIVEAYVAAHRSLMRLRRALEDAELVERCPANKGGNDKCICPRCFCGYALGSPGCKDWHNNHPYLKWGVRA